MTYTAFVQVELDRAPDIKHRHSVLHRSVLPAVEKLPGFKAVMWLNDQEGVGTCIAEFESNEQAIASLDVLAPSNGPRVLYAGTCVVELEARRTPPTEPPPLPEPPTGVPPPTLPPEA